jgi:hypothetical protein
MQVSFLVFIGPERGHLPAAVDVAHGHQDLCRYAVLPGGLLELRYEGKSRLRPLLGESHTGTNDPSWATPARPVPLSFRKSRRSTALGPDSSLDSCDRPVPSEHIPPSF